MRYIYNHSSSYLSFDVLLKANAIINLKFGKACIFEKNKFPDIYKLLFSLFF